MGNIKKWNGSSWVDITPQKRSGSSWVNVPVYKWNGSNWTTSMTTQQYTKTYETTWTQTYRENGTQRTDYRSQKLCQGRYVTEPWGIMRSMAGFNYSTIQSDLAGAKIDKVEIFLYAEHWYYVAGGTAVIGYHNTASRPSNYAYVTHGAKTEKFTARNQGRWITMPNAFGEGLRDNKYKGFNVFYNSTNMNYYGIFSGQNDGSNKPKIRITYTK